MLLKDIRMFGGCIPQLLRNGDERDGRRSLTGTMGIFGLMLTFGPLLPDLFGGLVGHTELMQ